MIIQISQVQRHRTNRCKEIQINLKRIAQHCMKYSRQKAMQVSVKDFPFIHLVLIFFSRKYFYIFFIFSLKSVSKKFHLVLED